ncbi:transposase [Massilia sp. SR12]
MARAGFRNIFEVMNRPLRLELDNSLYHITSRGDRRGRIFLSDSDRLAWLSILKETCERFGFAVLSYCQMGNHFHILLKAPHGGLARGMCHLNGKYSRYFNRVHGLVGHVFQGRYKAILCQRELYLLELTRYIELNPVRAKLVADPIEWIWSSYGAKMGIVDSPEWLKSGEVLEKFGSNLVAARRAYKDFVLEGIDIPSPLSKVSGELILGDPEFTASIVGRKLPKNPFEIKRVQRRAVVRPLADYFSEYCNPKEAMARAYMSLGYSMPEIAMHARVSVKTVSRAIAAFTTTSKAP